MSEKKQKVRRVFIPAKEAEIPLLAGREDGPRQKYPYAYFIEWALNTGKALNSNAQGARMQVHIDTAFRSPRENGEGKYFDLEQKPQPQWQALKEAVENPGEKGYPIPGRYLLDYIDSIAEAEEVELEE